MPATGANRSGAGSAQVGDSQANSPQADTGANISLKQVRAFIAIARGRSFTEAAGRIHLSPLVLSRLLQGLEVCVGEALVKRAGQSLSLTPAGEIFLPHALRLERAYAEALGMDEAVTSGPTHTFGVTSVAMPFILPRLLDCSARQRGCAGVSISEMSSHQIVAEVAAGRIDVGVCFASDAQCQGIKRLPVIQVPLGLLASNKLKLPKDINTLTDCAHLRFVRLQDDFVLPKALLASGALTDAYRKAGVVCSSIAALQSVVNEGQLAAFVSALAALSNTAEGMTFIPLPHLLPHLELSIVWNQDARIAPDRFRWTEALLAALREHQWAHGIQLLAGAK